MMFLPLVILMLAPAAGSGALDPGVHLPAPPRAIAPQAPAEPDPRAAAGPFLGQRPPGTTPEPFARELAPALGMTRAPVFSVDGGEAFWARSVGRFQSRIVTARLVGRNWTKPEPLPFSTGEFFDHNPALSSNGRRLVFASNRPVPGKTPTHLPGTEVPTSDLWMTERSGNGWSEPRPLGPAINTPADEDCPVFAGDGALYFSSSRPSPNGSPGGIFRAVAAGDGAEDPERLPAPVSEAGELVSGVGPGEAYLLFYSMRRGDGGGLCISFRTPDAAWSRPVALSPLFGDLRVHAASVTLDGRWLLLTATGPRAGVYWMSAEAVTALRPGSSTSRLPARNQAR